MEMDRQIAERACESVEIFFLVDAAKAMAPAYLDLLDEAESLRAQLAAVERERDGWRQRWEQLGLAAQVVMDGFHAEDCYCDADTIPCRWHQLEAALRGWPD